MPEELPTTLRDGRYAVIGMLGRGAQAQTLDAIDKQRGKAVAIKRFQVRGAASWKDVELAEREAHVLSSLSHEKLPVYVEHFEENGELFLVMDKVEGETLSAIRKRGARLARADIVRYLHDMSEVLDYLHGRAPPVIHRDIKPGNVIRRPDGSFALVDFGSVLDRLKPDGGSTVVGTFGYMAPEQFQGRALPQSDLYGVGATAISMLTGSDPETLPHKGLAIDVPAVLTRDPGLSALISRLLEPDPDKRAKSLGTLLDALEPERPPTGRTRVSSEGLPHHDHFSESSQRQRDSIPPFVFFLVVMGLTVARVAVNLTLRAFVPVLLTFLSLFFGAGLRRAAVNVRGAGRRADQAMQRAVRFLRGVERTHQTQDSGPRSHARHPYARRPDRRRARVIDAEAEVLEDEDDFDSESHESGRRGARSRRR